MGAVMESGRFGPFVVEKTLGRGQFGTVYLARHCETGSEVALKVLNSDVHENEFARHRFTRERIASSRFQHANVVQYIASSAQHETFPWIAFEYIAGPSLAWMFEEGLNFDDGVAVLIQVLQGLGHMHARGAVHRDVKPANIMVERTQGCLRAVVVDLGLVTFGDAVDEGSNEEGTPAYLAPELVLADRKPSVKSDLYAVGVMLFQLLEGRLPFEAAHGVAAALHHVTEPIPKLTKHPSTGSMKRWQEMVERAMAKDPAHRFSSAKDFMDQLRDLAGGEKSSNVDPVQDALDQALNEAITQARMTGGGSVHPFFKAPDQWRYRDAWRDGLRALEEFTSGEATGPLYLVGLNSPRLKIFAYHLVQSFSVIFEWDFEFDWSPSEQETQANSLGSIPTPEAQALAFERLWVSFRDITVANGSSIDSRSKKLEIYIGSIEALSPESSETVIQVQCCVNTETFGRAEPAIGIEQSLLELVRERSGGHDEKAMDYISHLWLHSEIHLAHHYFRLAPLANPMDWPMDGADGTFRLGVDLMLKNFGLELASYLLGSALILGPAWQTTLVRDALESIRGDVDVRTNAAIAYFECFWTINGKVSVPDFFASNHFLQRLTSIDGADRHLRFIGKSLGDLLVKNPTEGDRDGMIIRCFWLSLGGQGVVGGVNALCRAYLLQQKYQSACGLMKALALFAEQSLDLSPEDRTKVQHDTAALEFGAGEIDSAYERTLSIVRLSQEEARLESYWSNLFLLGLLFIVKNQESEARRVFETCVKNAYNDLEYRRSIPNAVWAFRWYVHWHTQGDLQKAQGCLDEWSRIQELPPHRVPALVGMVKGLMDGPNEALSSGLWPACRRWLSKRSD